MTMASDVHVQRRPLERDDRDKVRASLEAFARESGGLRGVGADAAVAASRAYWQARAVGLSEEQSAAQMHQAQDDLASSERLVMQAELTPDVGRGIAWDVVAGWVPTVFFVAVLWVAALVMNKEVQFRQVAAAAGLLAIVAAVAAGLALGRLDRYRLGARLLAFAGGPASPVLTGSVGALVVGIPLLLFVGLSLSLYTKDEELAGGRLLARNFQQVDAAVAMTVAAAKVGTEPQRASDLVSQETGVGWIVENLRPSIGAVMARAKFVDGEAVVTYAQGDAPDAPSCVLETRLSMHGKPPAVRRYHYGIVAAVEYPADARTFSLASDACSMPMVFKLPAGTLPPTPGAEVVVSQKASGETASLQTVDGVMQRLQAQKQTTPAPHGATAPGAVTTPK